MTKETKSHWDTPCPVSDADMTFGCNLVNLLPPYEDIPKEFKDVNNPWCAWQQEWFFKGFSKDRIPKAKEGIDNKKATRHLQTIQSSFEPKHEHKEAGVAYLASLWFEELPKMKERQ